MRITRSTRSTPRDNISTGYLGLIFYKTPGWVKVKFGNKFYRFFCYLHNDNRFLRYSCVPMDQKPGFYREANH